MQNILVSIHFGVENAADCVENTGLSTFSRLSEGQIFF